MDNKLDDTVIQMILAGTSRGINGSEFSLRMSNKISLWKDISYSDVKKIITLVHASPLAIYTIIPFFYKVLGIDLCKFYLDMNNNIWHNQEMAKYINNFDRFPLTIRGECKMIALNFDQLKNIRNNLLSEGAKPVKEIIIFVYDGRSYKKQQHPLDLMSLPVDHPCYL